MKFSGPASSPRQWQAFIWQRLRPRDLLGLGAFWTLLALASLWGWLAPLDGRLFDLAIRAVPGETPSNVAIVRADPGAAAAQASALRLAGATRIVDLGPEDLETSARDVAFVAPDAARCRPPAPDGVVRALRLHDAAGRPCPLGRLAVDAGLRAPDVAMLSPDFSARTSTSIPRLDAALPVGVALRTAVEGRIVVRAPAPDLPTYVTPLYGADGLLEPSVPYAMALDALTRGRAIRWTSPGLDVLAAALVALLLHLSLRRSSYRVTLTVALLSTVPVLLALLVVLHAGRIHIPATASLVAIAGFALRTILRRNRALSDTLVDIDHRLTGLVGQPLGQGFELATALVWEHANRFVTEFFDLRRSLMLELPAGTTHMRPVAAFGCTPGDIIEKRRDYRRAPYSTALARELPTPPSRPFLPDEAGVVDLITPLMAADQLVGFWAFSVTAPAGATLDTLIGEAARYANEIAKVILRAGDTGAAADPAARRWPSLERTRARLLDGATQAREQLAAHRDVFAAVGHPIAVCDLLGRVQFANPAFEEFAEAITQPLAALSVTGMLEQQCDLAPAVAKQTMRHVILGTGAEARLPMPDSMAATPQALVLRPILRRAQDHASAAVSPFDLLGMIVEIVPDARSAELATRLGQAAARYARRSEATLDAIARTVGSLGVDPGSREQLAGIVASGLDDARHLLQQSEAGPEADDGGATRLDLQQLLQRVSKAHARLAREKAVEIHLPQDVPMVAAAEEPIAQLLRDLLALLLDDAAPGSALEIALAPHAGATLQLRIANDGYGMPTWHVQDVMRDGADLVLRPESSLLERVAHAAAALEDRSVFRLEAALGKGYMAMLTLPRAP